MEEDEEEKDASSWGGSRTVRSRDRLWRSAIVLSLLLLIDIF